MTRCRPSAAPDCCPVCGAEVPEGARACPECGSDERTGWSEQAAADGLGLPDESFDHADFVQREFGGGPRRTRRQWFWAAVALGLLILFAWMMLSR